MVVLQTSVACRGNSVEVRPRVGVCLDPVAARISSVLTKSESLSTQMAF
jgi:hypothetical protein